MSSSEPVEGHARAGRWHRCDGVDLVIRMLGERFRGEVAQEPEPTRTYPLAPFQESAVARARRVLRWRGGVVVADSVGLGKTFVALALIEEAFGRGERVVVAVPAVLRPGWTRQLRGLARGADGRCAVVSHAQLSRGTHRPDSLGGCRLVVVDEAHRFRNPRTRRYAALAELCRSARVVLVTATPVNNAASDLLHLLRLFARDHAFRDIGIASLREAFEAGEVPEDDAVERAREPMVPLPAIARLVEEVVIRRTRADVRPGSGAGCAGPTGPRFPICAAPTLLRPAQAPDLDRVVGLILDLELAAYETAGDGAGVAALVRLGLLKRLDSSRGALRESARRITSFDRSVVEAAVGGRLLRVRDTPRDPQDPDQLVLTDLVADTAPPGFDLDDLLRSTTRDLERLRKLLALLAGPDPKVEVLAELLDRCAAEKTLVFTEYRATAAGLWRLLARRYRVGRVDGSGAWLGQRPAGRRAVLERFAPAANGARPRPDRERVDVLIATDVLSEGVNLQDARHVVSYDLPWNPVRLLQRIGRIDRLGSPHDRVFPYLIAPGPGLDAALRLTARLRSKLGAIEASVGAERAAEILDRLTAGGTAARESLATLERRTGSASERLRRAWASTDRYGAVPAGAEPDSVLWGVISGPAGKPGTVLVLARLGQRPWLLEVGERDVHTPSLETVEAIEVAVLSGSGEDVGARWLDRRPGPTESPPSIVEHAVTRARSFLGTLRVGLLQPAPVGAGSTAAIVATRLRRALDLPGTVLSRDLLRRAERLLEALGRPLGPVAEAAVRALAAEPAGHPAVAPLLTRLEAAIEEERDASDPSRTDDPPDIAILAALLVRGSNEPRDAG